MMLIVNLNAMLHSVKPGCIVKRGAVGHNTSMMASQIADFDSIPAVAVVQMLPELRTTAWWIPAWTRVLFPWMSLY